MKDGEIAALVNKLTRIAQTYGEAQQLRERISAAVIEAQPTQVDWAEVDEELLTILHASRVDGDSMKSDLRALLRKVSGQ